MRAEEDARGREPEGLSLLAFSPEERIFLREVEEQACRCEQAIALLEQFRPLNWREECARLESLWQRGEPAVPLFQYGSAPQLHAVRNQLERLQTACERYLAPRLAALLCARLVELEREAQLVERRGQAELWRLSRERFVWSSAEEHSAQLCAERWLDRSSEPEELGQTVLLSRALLLHPGVRDLAIPVREAEIPSLAAVAGDALLVQTGARVPLQEVERIFVHEVGAHLLPRRRARTGGPLLQMGTAACSEDEEGRAIWLEERAGLLSASRKRELAFRFLASQEVRAGAPACEVIVRLLERGAELAQAVRVAARALRGGGLAREVVYLAGFVRVSESVASGAPWERTLAWGRLSLQGAEELFRAGYFDKAAWQAARSNSSTTGV